MNNDIFSRRHFLGYTLATVALSSHSSLTWAQAKTPTNANAPILVLNSLNANVSVIDPVTWTEIKRVPVGKEPHHLYLTPDEKSVLVGNAEGDSITFMDPKTGAVQRTMTGILDPYHLRFSPDMKWFVIAANRLNHIDVYTWENKAGEFKLHLAKRIAAGKTPSHIAIDSQSKIAYITLQDSNELTAIELATQKRLWTIKVGKIPADLYLAPDDKTLLIGLTGASEVEAYDLSSGKAVLKQRLPTGKGAHAFRSQGDKRHVFVSNRTENTISRIDWKTLKVVDTYRTPAGPDCMELMADGKTLLVTARWASRLAVIDLEKKAVIRQIPVGKSPHGVWTLNHASRD